MPPSLNIKFLKALFYMSKQFFIGLGLGVAVGLSIILMMNLRVDIYESGAASLPSSKAAVSMGQLIDLGALASTTGSSLADTTYKTVMTALIKTSNQADLSADVAVQCGLVTDTTVKSKTGTSDSSSAKGSVTVRVKTTNQSTSQVRYFYPTESGGTESNPAGVTYCSRVQQLDAKFAGLNCTADLTTGVVTCTDPESLQLILATLNANSFNYLLPDMSPGVWKIEVQARAKSAVSLSGSGLGAASANAFVGLGSTRVETLRLIKDANTSVDLQ